ncbi:hypothetical protein LZ634_22565, partial [Kluyvera intermedia]|uniref:hypothetical protein n=1 Tax=Kluyvera intermedia TaxID=61648 RepID=UPI001F36A085
GSISTILFNLVVNKDPFKIDSDSISALANVGTFLVALIAALQVNKWLNSKINDTAFKQTVSILEIIEGFHGKLHPLTSSISDIMSLEYPKQEHDKIKIEKAKICINEMHSLGTAFIMKIRTLRHWKVNLTNNAHLYLSSLEKELIELMKNSQLVLEHVQNNNTPVSDELTMNINTNYLKISATIIQLTSFSYDEIFDKDSLHHP